MVMNDNFDSISEVSCVIQLHGYLFSDDLWK